MMDVLAIFGIFLAFTGFVSQKFCTAPTFAALWVLYYSLYQVGQTFMWFQWDILLLEAGFLSILVAPVKHRPIVRRRSISIQSPSDTIAFWLVKWLLFRLMFQSGIVKLTSNCPTWWGLTALTVHFESQCLPTPLAWYAHQLPGWFLKLMCVGANIAEIPLPILFFVPVRCVRVVALYAEWFFQVCIMLTGNYNFFNLLTIVLLLSLSDDDSFLEKHPHKGSSTFWIGLLSKAVTLIRYAALLYGTVVWYSIRITPKNTIESDIAFTKQQFDQALSKAVPLTLDMGLASLGLLIVKAFCTALIKPHPNVRRAVFINAFLHANAALLIFGISIVSHASLHPSSNSMVRPDLRALESRLTHLHITNAYGLFHRMTDGGRPEVIIEGSNHIEGPWQEYNFLFKVGNVSAEPPFVAPHQPRLDWQMCLAALGTYHQNPWLMSLAYRLLIGQPEVLQLLDISRNPFPNEPPKYIRATLYRYHYTPWTQTMGGFAAAMTTVVVPVTLTTLHSLQLNSVISKVPDENSQTRVANLLSSQAQVRQITQYATSNKTVDKTLSQPGTEMPENKTKQFTTSVVSNSCGNGSSCSGGSPMPKTPALPKNSGGGHIDTIPDKTGDSVGQGIESVTEKAVENTSSPQASMDIDNGDHVA